MTNRTGLIFENDTPCVLLIAANCTFEHKPDYNLVTTMRFKINQQSLLKVDSLKLSV
ncbi:hypothetical protein N481_14210 [Pseudoalteromonas luteoviolacea S4047-1]|uniref:Uncharacterized protein n=1 Tax=Pseudoalteromonas luteoviolacea S4054 TaxID=1129367 RepID=A0A0F6ACN6_9GAMM|nr:hypothetical protein N479_13075 [Pseudoalteromonas luteoviolacea S4054]KZN72775.1 hypothetical protein N481_14210 [Pseudoalteromonas luteoviolacea S4047-1]